MVDYTRIERRIVVWTRYFTLIAVLGSLAGALLMFVLGLLNIVEAFHVTFTVDEAAPTPDDEEGSAVVESLAVISVIEGLDRFLIAIVLLYFSYGVYSLFIRPGEAESDLSLPQWLRVKQIGQLKQVVAEVIIVILFVLFLRVALRVFQDTTSLPSWLQVATILVLPVCTLMLGMALRLVQLHPKPMPPAVGSGRSLDDDDDRPATPNQDKQES